MPFAPSTAPVPDGFNEPRFALEPIGPHLAAPDLEAVLASRALLRRWSASDWPEDDFGLDANAADLAEHAADHAARRAFGYSVRDPQTGLVLGSVYVRDVAEYLDRWTVAEPQRAALARHPLAVEWWFRADQVERFPEFFDALHAWIRRAWPGPPLFGSRANTPEWTAIYLTRGLREQAVIRSPGGVTVHLYG